MMSNKELDDLALDICVAVSRLRHWTSRVEAKLARLQVELARRAREEAGNVE